MLDSKPRGRGFKPGWRHRIVSVSKNVNPSLVLVQPRKTCSFITERLLMGCKESNQKPCPLDIMLQNGHSQKDRKLVFKTNYCLMQVKSIVEHSAILSTFIKLPFVIKILFLSIFEWPFYTGFV